MASVRVAHVPVLTKVGSAITVTFQIVQGIQLIAMVLEVVTSPPTHQVVTATTVTWEPPVRVSVSMATPTRMVRNVYAIAVIQGIVARRPAVVGDLAQMTPVSVTLDGGVSIDSYFTTRFVS